MSSSLITALVSVCLTFTLGMVGYGLRQLLASLAKLREGLDSLDTRISRLEWWKQECDKRRGITIPREG